MKKTLSVILALTLLLSAVSINVFAEQATPAITNVTSPGLGYSLVPLELGVMRHSDKNTGSNAEPFTSFGAMSFSENTYYLQPHFYDYNNATYTGSGNEWLSFKINRSANIYITSYITVTDSQMSWVSTDGFMAVGTDGTSLISARTQNHDLMTYISNNSSSSNNSRKRAHLFKKTFKLAQDGSEVQTITLKSAGINNSNYGVYGVIVEFIPEKECPVTNINYRGSTMNAVELKLNETARYSDMSNEVFTSFGGMTFGDNCWYLQPTFDDGRTSNFSGAAHTYASTYNDSSATWLSFDLTKSADVYVVSYVNVTGTYLPWLSDEGYAAINSSLIPDQAWIAGSEKMFLTNASTSTNGSRTKAYLYKKTFYVPYGSNSPTTVTMKGTGYANAGYGVYGVIVDFLDESEPMVTNVESYGSYNVVSPILINKTPRYSDKQGDVFTSFGGVTFGENSWYLQPKFADVNDENVNYIYQNPYYDWLSFDINQTADVYVLTYQAVTDDWLVWMEDGEPDYKPIAAGGSGLLPSARGATPTAAAYATNNTDPNSNSNARKRAYLYKKTFYVPYGSSETTTITMGGTGIDNQDFGIYGVIVDFPDESATLQNISINGDSLSGFSPLTFDYEVYDLEENPTVTWTVTDAGATVVKSETESAITLTVTNGTQSNIYTITKVDLPEELGTITSAFPAFNSQERGVYIRDDVIYKEYAIVFATAPTHIGLLKRGQFGMLLSDTAINAESFTIDNENISIYPATNGAGEKGNFGIMFFTNDSQLCGVHYYARPYSYYGDKIIYGSIIDMDM